MISAVIAAFSMYSRIPMPKIEWNEKCMKYSMCCFPLVGVVTGLCSIILFYGLGALGLGRPFIAGVLTVLPVLINGGIHMDGFLDTMDAKNSYKPMEEKLKILKDPHAGAFAIICGLVYMMLLFAAFSEVREEGILCIAVGYAYSRTLSGLSIVTLRKAKKDGMAASAADASQKNVKWILAAELAVCVIVLPCLHPVLGAACILAGAVSFVHYRHMAYKCFGGITGDLAGYFLQICELLIAFSVAVLQAVLYTAA